MEIKRKYPIGAELVSNRGVHFRIWAKNHRKANLILESRTAEPKTFSMKREKGGYFSLFVPECKANDLYRFKLGGKEAWLADPASRFQPIGPTGASQVIDPRYSWTDAKWRGISLEKLILYEMHIGTFTKEGTFKAASDQLEELARLGINGIELMPINDFPGHFGWGYDGVNFFAPTRLYGTPTDVKAFINKAHQVGIAVFLDIVYNHFGPEANHMLDFSNGYLSDKHETDWGKAINFDDPSSREFFLTNVRYWIEEYHLDGLRVDATPWLFSSTPTHILADITQTAKKAATKKKIIVIGENEPQDTKLLMSYKDNGYGFDTLWNDDFHHSAHVKLTGKREAYYTDYIGTAQEFISAVKYGFLYQGQYYAWQKKPRGTFNLNLPHEAFVVFLENHDQIANSGEGNPLHILSDPGNFKALTCLLLLGPNIPLLFQGQEFASSKPFYYFADHDEDLSKLIEKGRKKSLAQFPRLATAEMRKKLPNPSDPLTFTSCKLDFSERQKKSKLYVMHRDLIKLRKEDPVFKKMQRIKIDGAVINQDSFLLRYFDDEGHGDRLLIINFGPDFTYSPCPEPLLVAGKGLIWETLWSSESSDYGGEGTPRNNIPYWNILGHSAIVLKTKKKPTKANGNL